MYSFFKRTLDISASFFALIIFFPIMVMIAITIKINSFGPIFYKGQRAALNGGVFYIYKFRTMIVNAESKGGFSTAVNDIRLTSIGRFLRKYKLDELPQFINVLLGDMSLVGPRPQVIYYTEQYEGDNCLILTVKPGMTDLASIYFVDMDKTLGSGDVDKKYHTEIEPIKNKLRVRYVKNMSFLLDIRILVETVFAVMGVRNITGLRIDDK